MSTDSLRPTRLPLTDEQKDANRLIDQLVTEALAREEAEIADRDAADAEKKRIEQEEKDAAAIKMLTVALGPEIVAALAPVTGPSWSNAQFSYKGKAFRVWKADRSQGYGIRHVVSNSYEQDYMAFVDAPEGILRYIGRATLAVRADDELPLDDLDLDGGW